MNAAVACDAWLRANQISFPAACQCCNEGAWERVSESEGCGVTAGTISHSPEELKLAFFPNIYESTLMRQESLRTNSMKFLRVPIGENSKICKNYSSDSKQVKQTVCISGRKKETQIDRHLKTATTIPLTEKKSQRRSFTICMRAGASRHSNNRYMCCSR